MTPKLIYDGITNTNLTTITNTFNSKSFCYAQVANFPDDWEIDAFLNLITPAGNRLIKTEKFEINTREILTLPKQIYDTGWDCYFLLTTDFALHLKVWAVEGDLNADRVIKFRKYLLSNTSVEITGYNMIITNLITLPLIASFLIELVDQNNITYFSGNNEFPLTVSNNHKVFIRNIDIIDYDIFLYAKYCSEVEEITL